MHDPEKTWVLHKLKKIENYGGDGMNYVMVDGSLYKCLVWPRLILLPF